MEIERTANLNPATKEKWYLSMTSAKPKKTLTIKFDNGKSYKYVGKENVKVGDPVIIGYGGATSYKMGNVIAVEDGGKIKKALNPLFTFTTNPEKNDIIKNATKLKWPKEIDDLDEGMDEYCYLVDGEETFGIIDFLIDIVLNAITVIAFPELCSENTVNTARNVLSSTKHIPSVLFGEEYEGGYYGSGWEYKDSTLVLTGFYPGWKEDLFNLKLLEPILKEHNISADNEAVFCVPILEENNVYFESANSEAAFCIRFYEGNDEIESFFGDNEEFKTFTNELVMRSALSILIRGGFVNLLEAALSTEMPIKSFYEKLKDFAKEIGSNECLDVLNKIDYENLTF